MIIVEEIRFSLGEIGSSWIIERTLRRFRSKIGDDVLCTLIILLISNVPRYEKLLTTEHLMLYRNCYDRLFSVSSKCLAFLNYVNVRH